jgi:hypothetical protein
MYRLIMQLINDKMIYWLSCPFCLNCMNALMSKYEYVRNCIAMYFERLQMQGPSGWSNYAVTWGCVGKLG